MPNRKQKPENKNESGNAAKLPVNSSKLLPNKEKKQKPLSIGLALLRTKQVYRPNDGDDVPF